MNFILFNGPPRSGKDTAAKYAYWAANDAGYRSVWEKFSAPLKRSFAGMMNTGLDMWMNVHHWEDHKEEVVPPLGVSFRQWQIDMSEKFMKPLYGEDVFGRLLAERCIQQSLYKYTGEKENVFIISDCGFQIEVNHIGSQHNVLFFKLERVGCSFDADSRGWVVPRPEWSNFIVFNNGSIHDLATTIEQRTKEWLSKIEADNSPW